MTNLFQSMQNIDRRILYSIILLSVAVVTLQPVGLPVPIGKPSRDLYTEIESMPEGSYILFNLGLGAASYNELGPASAAVVSHIIRRPLKLVMVTFSLESVPLVKLMLDTQVKIPDGKVYGQDFVFMGYIAGVETGMAALASDFRKTAPEDYQNTPIDELPILNNISNAKNFVLVIDTTGGTDTVEQFIRQWYTPYGVKYTGILTAGIVPAVMAYYPKQMFAYLYGARGGAEYELLVRIPGKNLMMTDAISIAHVFFFVFVLIANIGYIGDRLSKNKKEDGGLKQ